MNDTRQRIANLSPEQRAQLEQRLLAKQLPRESRTIPSQPTRAPYPLSFAQQRLWFLTELDPDSPAYNVPEAVRLHGPLNLEALQQSLDAIVVRHQVLRTTYTRTPTIDVPQQVVNPSRPVDLCVVDIQDVPEEERDIELRRLCLEESRRPFDLSVDLMLRSLLVQLDKDDYGLLVVIHHIATDGWSMGILWQELSRLYDIYQQRDEPSLNVLPIEYTDYALWQRERLQGQHLDTLVQYWKRQLTDIPTLLDLPTDRPRPCVQTYCGAQYRFSLAPSVTEALKGVSRQEEVTLFVFLLTTWQILLHRYTGQDTIIVGAPIAGRLYQETESLIGLFVNTLVLRADLGDSPPFLDLLRQIREVAIDAYERQELPFEKLVEELQPERSLNHLPICQVAFTFQNMPRPDQQMEGLMVTPLAVEQATAQFDLALTVSETGDSLSAMLTYNTDLFEPSTMSRLAANWEALLEGIITNPKQRISNLPLMSQAERDQVLVAWNNTATDYPRHVCIHQLFELQADQRPESVALVCGEYHLTYRDLNAQANRLASFLQKRGVGPDVLVGVCLERSLEMIISLLGILKAGGAYVPIDPSYLPDRLAYIFDDTQLSVLITQASLYAAMPEQPKTVICLDTDQELIAGERVTNSVNRVQAEDLAYVMYTSGSTGRPKGVSITHRGVVKLVTGATYVDFAATDVFLQLAPLTFDASTFEIWGSLLNGGQLILLPEQQPTSQDVSQMLNQHLITVLWLTAELFHQMVDYELESLTSVRQLLAGGDVLSPNHVARALMQLGGGRLMNGYGPTENTTFACSYLIKLTKTDALSVPIGKPISNTQAYVLDAYQHPVPIGVPGELYLGGDGLARGYWNHPQLTAAKFLPYPFQSEPGAYLYKTGDRVRYRADGNLEFLGRLDQQVKIRGFRIELGEVEVVIAQFPAVRQVVAIARPTPSGSKQLMAYVVLATGVALDQMAMRRYLKLKLPDYMIPSSVMQLDALPMTANGKINRQTLPEPSPLGIEFGHPFIVPRTPLERQLVDIWCDLLALDQIGSEDDFFELGGHSLLATQLIYRLRTTLGIDLSLRQLYEGPTVAQLARQISRQDERLDRGALVASHTEGTRPPFFWINGGESTVLLRKHLGPDQPLYGFGYESEDGGAARYTSIKTIAAHYLEEVQRVQPYGPYFLGGFSVGGLIAFEMAQQLLKQGDRIGFLLMLEPSLLHHRLDPVQLPGHAPAFLSRSWYSLLRRVKTCLCQLYVSLGQRIPIVLRNFYMLDMYYRAICQYYPAVFPGRIYWIQRQQETDAPPTGWGDLATGGFVTYELQTSFEHTELVKTAQAVQCWGTIVADCLHSAQNAGDNVLAGSVH